ncbi:hypothetical protein [Rarobacter incanus]|uniref:Secretion/DNA translocation related TadE-like protein n=1 Tax=Rarobacter incanus TaxID=153494 RepID=A0A542SP97_9MICO|nr:hypothetical protein [Rarobacter incanus]TQK76412.1 hypothetical protein FB389_1083 [Rarobacter incanus]
MTSVMAAIVAIGVALGSVLAMVIGNHIERVRVQGVADIAAVAAATAAQSDRFPPCQVATEVVERAKGVVGSCDVDAAGVASVIVRLDPGGPAGSARAGPQEAAGEVRARP